VQQEGLPTLPRSTKCDDKDLTKLCMRSLTALGRGRMVTIHRDRWKKLFRPGILVTSVSSSPRGFLHRAQGHSGFADAGPTKPQVFTTPEPSVSRSSDFQPLFKLRQFPREIVVLSHGGSFDRLNLATMQRRQRRIRFPPEINRPFGVRSAG
jgi:hypothetical protein